MRLGCEVCEHGGGNVRLANYIIQCTKVAAGEVAWSDVCKQQLLGRRRLAHLNCSVAGAKAWSVLDLGSACGLIWGVYVVRVAYW